MNNNNFQIVQTAYHNFIFNFKYINRTEKGKLYSFHNGEYTIVADKINFSGNLSYSGVSLDIIKYF